MKKIILKTRIVCAALLASLALSCSNDDDVNLEEEMMPMNIVETAQDADQLSSLVAALQQADAGLVETLSGDGPFTVFAPTNDAFSDLLNVLGDDYNSLSDFDEEAEKNLLRDILLYHVITSEVRAADLAAGNVASAFNGNNIEVIASGNTFVLGDASDTDANITAADIMASNGVVHLIDKILLPQSAIDFVMDLESKNIVELAQSVDDLSILVEALVQADAGLVDTLSGDGPFTVFAPTNAAFAALLAVLGDDYNSLADFDTDEEKAMLAKILTYHVVGAQALSTDLSDGQEIATVQGENVMVSLDGGVFIGDATDMSAQVTLADQMASNGVVHVIDKVLIPQEILDALAPNIVGLAQSVDDLSLLVDALIQADAGLVETLSGDGPFTVFAPTNAAFAALLNELGDDYNSLADFDTDEEKAMLAKILTYHVVGAQALSTDLSDGQEIATVQGENVMVSLDGGVFIGDATDMSAQVTLADQMASNGVVHVIDKVLLPQEILDTMTPNIVELAQSVDDLSLLVEALIQADAGLVETLSGDGPFTVFAPTNAAFVALLDILGDEYNSLADFDTEAEKEILAKILTYHVVGAQALSTDLSDGQEIATVQGENVMVNLTGGVFIQDPTDTDAEVVLADQLASNGVAHVVDKVLLPQEVLDLLGH